MLEMWNPGSVFSVVLLGAVLAQAQTRPENMIAGHVAASESSRPLANVVVVAHPLEGRASFSTKTDEQGQFVIEGVVPGVYAFELVYERERFAVRKRFDARDEKPFLLHLCLALDPESARLSDEDCPLPELEALRSSNARVLLSGRSIAAGGIDLKALERREAGSPRPRAPKR